MKLIPLTLGQFALVDDADYSELSKYTWYAKKDRDTFYAARNITVSPYKQKILRMHREIMRAVGKVDHRDGDGLNNQRHNLRLATNQQNGANRRKLTTTSSKFKGACWNIQNKKWTSYITFSSKRKHLGYFDTEIDAARAYDVAARKYFGEFANVNFP